MEFSLIGFMDERIQKQGDLVQKMLERGIANIEDHSGDNLVEQTQSKRSDMTGLTAAEIFVESDEEYATKMYDKALKRAKEVYDSLNSAGFFQEGEVESTVKPDDGAKLVPSQKRVAKRQKKDVSEVPVSCLHLRIPEDLKDELHICAIKSHMSMTDFVINLVKKEIAKRNKN